MKLRWIPVVAWMGLIFYLSHQDGASSTLQSGLVLDFLQSLGLSITEADMPAVAGLIRKLAHFTEYAILYFLLTRIPLKTIWCLVIVLLFSISDEWHKSYIPGRSGELFDVGIDLLGAFFVMILLRLEAYFKPVIK